MSATRLQKGKTLIQERVLSYGHDMKTGAGSDDVIELTGNEITLEVLNRICAGAKVVIPEETIVNLKKSRSIIDGIVEADAAVYGINTGFGLMSHTKIDIPDLHKLQANLIRSHASGVGTPLEPDVVRRIMALRINVLARGHSGISLSMVQVLVDLLNAGLTPEVPCQGTVGASGDLAPLAHVALGCMGEGKIHDPTVGKYVRARDALARHNITPAVLGAKDGLSMVNGTQFITGVGSGALENALKSCQAAQPVMALTLVALHGHLNAFDHRVHEECRPHPGAAVVASCIRKLVPPESHHTTLNDVQDAYSLRCTPAIHGPALEMLVTIRDTIEFEMNCSTDNPLVLNKEEKCEFTGKTKPKLLSAGNFHGEYPAKALDTMVLYVGEIGRASAARVSMLVDPSRNRELPAFLASDAGLDSGFMCWELTAAALDAENRTLSMPASAETINTGAGKEDHVSMGGFGARKAVQVIENVQKIMTIELMAGIHAVHRRNANTSGNPGTGKDFRLPPLLQRLFDKVAPMSPPMDCDRYLKDDYDDLLHYVMHDLPLDADLVNP